ncbi:MAG: hypothetical protein GY705_21010 [Bacteroidetes bacterium]|nr:hypothetical protein [Bacteroidota bacterium]
MRKLPLLIFILFFFFFVPAFSQQKPAETAAEFEKAYKWRIRQERLEDVYIPRDLTEVFLELNRLTDKESKIKFKNIPEEIVASKLYFSLGRWIIRNWGFHQGSRLSHFLRNLGLYHPEDMATFIIIAYHRNLNKEKLEVKVLVEKLSEERKKEWEERKKKGTILYEETRKRPKN